MCRNDSFGTLLLLMGCGLKATKGCGLKAWDVVGCGLKATKDNFSCSSLNAFKEIRVSSRTIIKNDITIINDSATEH